MRAAVIAALLLLGGPAVARAQAAPFRYSAHADFQYVAGEYERAAGFFPGTLRAAGEYAVADRWSLFAELVTRARTLDATFERIAVRWAARDDLTLAAGRLHSPISYWTATYAPGSWNRTSVSIPVIANPDMGVLPIHMVGARADGRRSAGAFEFMASAAYGNGREPASGGPGDGGDLDGNRAWSLALAALPRELDGLRVGGAVYGDRPLTLYGREVDVRILTAHAALDRGGAELAAEYVRIGHEADADEYVNRGYWAQFGYRLAERYLRLKPYVRLEQFNVVNDDPVYGGDFRDRHATIGGVRYDFLRTGALKAELRYERIGSADRTTSLHVEASFRVAGPDGRPPTLLAGPPEPPERSAQDTSATGDVAEKAAPEVAVGDASPVQPPRRQPPSAAARRGAAANPSEPRRVGVAIVVHPATPVSDVTLPELRRIFRGEQSVWPGDERVVLLVRTPLPVERDVVLDRIYQMDETEFRQYWLGRIFRDATATGPRVVSDPETARQLVAALPGAISFLPADQVGPELRVLRIDGKLPGEPGYPLQ